MYQTKNRIKQASKLASILKKAIPNNNLEMTISDASAKSGLSLNDSKIALNYLLSEYRGHLSVTNSGILLFKFPYRFAKPWEKKDKRIVILNKFKNGFLGIAKFFVRAWVSVVLIGYVIVFSLILIVLTLAKNDDRDSDDSSFSSRLLPHMLFRLIFDALFWTFHPFSSFKSSNYKCYKKEKNSNFYEKVNRFVFGPEKHIEGSLFNRKLIISQIRSKKGVVGLSDIIRITGLDIKSANSLISKLILDYDGDIIVSNNGGIIYKFSELRKSVNGDSLVEVESIWLTRRKLLPLIGNTIYINMLIILLNVFNILMSWIAIKNNWTMEKLHFMFTNSYEVSNLDFVFSNYTPLVLGWIPLFFSTTLLIFPLSRFILRYSEIKKNQLENGRRGILKIILTKLTLKGVDENLLISSFKSFSGRKPTSKELMHEIITMGGELSFIKDNKTFYRFKDLENESIALKAERFKAENKESDVGYVIFSSDN